MWFAIFGGIFILIGLAIGYLLRKILARRKIDSYEAKIEKMLEDARNEAKEILINAKDKAVKILEDAKKEERERREELSAIEKRIERKEEFIDKKFQDLEVIKQELRKKIAKIREMKQNLEELKEQELKLIEKVAGMTKEQATEELFKKIEQENSQTILDRIRKIEQEGLETYERKAKEILAAIIQRLASAQATEITTSSVALPSEEFKGKIIGKEGRNIRAFEKETGVELIVDETPDAIIISSFDPIRRQVAKIALEKLIADGRIQPARIEEFVRKAQEEINKNIKEAGEEAVREVGLVGLDPKLIQLLGRLKYRTSFGQNVLRHSIEAAHLAGMLASELNADITICKKAALLHDIGKALDHEVEGSHVEIGRKILQKFKIDDAIIKAMQSHHEEYPYETLESVIVQTAEAISASRPGARRDTLENYLKRLAELENIAKSFEGVEKAYAIQAGRELRIFVTPEKVDDLVAYNLAKKIAQTIEKELKYPGEIKVMVIRETRVIEYAK